MYKFIGLSGLANSGKDTVADFICLKYNWRKIGFADVIKRQVGELYNLSYKQLYGPSENRNKIDERYNLSSRDILKKFGDAGRDCSIHTYTNYAINIGKHLIDSNTKENSYSQETGLHLNSNSLTPIPRGVIFKDIRYKQEFNVIKDLGALMIRIKRVQLLEKNDLNTHSSETEQQSISDSEFDYILYNNDSISKLYLNIHDMYNTYLKE